jgi:hypothetical protein
MRDAGLLRERNRTGHRLCCNIGTVEGDEDAGEHILLLAIRSGLRSAC